VSHVSAKAARLLVEAVEARGIDPAVVARATSLTLEHLRNPTAFISWDEFCALNEAAVRAVGGARAGEELGVTMVSVESYRLFRRAAGLVMSPHQLHVIGAHWFAPAMFPGVRLELESATPRLVIVNIEIDSALRGCESFLQIGRGTMVGMSTLLGLPLSQVHGPIGSHSARLHIVLPEARRSLPSLLKRARAMFAGSGLFDELARAQVEMNSAYGALLRSHQNFRAVLESAPMGVAIHRDGHYIWANSSLAASLGWESPSQLIGRPVLDDTHPEERAQVVDRLSKPPSLSKLGDWRIRRRDGTYILMEIAATQEIEFDGAPARLLIAHDVSEQRRVREQLAVADRMASLGMLAAGVGHELNNPLTYVQLNLGLIAREIDRTGASPLLKAVTGEAMEGVDRMRAIVADLRTLARTDEEKVEPVDVEAALDSALRLSSKTTERAATVERDRGSTSFARANRARLGQVLLNLIINAHEAIEDRGGRGLIRVRTLRLESGDVCIEIADSGIGVRGADLARVFDPFFTTKAVGRGTGLGLAICHQIVTRFGGRITITSEPEAVGDRTLRTFVRVALPAAPTPVAANGITPRSSRRVLIVDDEPLITRALELVLSERHEVVVVDTGRAALDRLTRDRSFDLVLCDITMPDIDGIELFEQTRRLDQQLAERFVFMTGGASTPRARAFLAQCGNRRLDKPFDVARVVAIADGH